MTNPNPTTNPSTRLSKRIQNALGGGYDALRKGQPDLASDFLTTAEGLFEDLPPSVQIMAQPALDALDDAIVARLSVVHDARKGEGAFSYADA